MPAPRAGRARAGLHELAEGAAAHLLHLAGPAARLAGVDRRTRLGAVATTALAGRDRVERNVAAGPGDHLGEADLDLDPDVGARRRPAAAAATEDVAERRVPLAEEGGEDVIDATGGVRREAAAAQPLVAVRVVGAAALRIGEHLVGLRRLLELLLGLRILAC